MAEQLNLTVYVVNHCEVCRYALEIAADIRRRYPHVLLQVIDLETSREPVPEVVFATPTYLLNGRVWSLGNPSEVQIRAAFTKIAV